MKGKRVLKKQKEQLNKSLLGTYFVSLFSVLLSFVMLLGTTFAWFYTDTTSAGNEIHSGILKVDMIHNGVSLDDEKNHAVFSSEVWAPGDTQVETIEICNVGNVPLNYKLSFAPVPNSRSAVDITDLFTVYVKEGGVAKAERARLLANGPADMDGWTELGTLNKFLLTGAEKYLCQGELSVPPAPNAKQTVSIAIQMAPLGQVPDGVQNESAHIWLKLEATQYIPTDNQGAVLAKDAVGGVVR